MKKIICFLLLFATSYAFSQEVTLSGKITNYSGTDSLKLLVYSSQSPSEVSIGVSKKGEFSYILPATMSYFSKLYFSPDDFILLIVSPNEKVKIQATYGSMSTSNTVTGSEQTDLWYKNNTKITAFNTEINDRKAIFEQTIDSIGKKKAEYIVSYIKENPSSMAGLAMIDMLDISLYPEVYELLDKTLMKTQPTNPIVQNFHTSLQQVFFLKEGTSAPDITLTDINGKLVSLSSLKGKVVLIDFWATWCKPCRMEIPNIQNAYTIYKNKGFEVYSVSIDNDKAAWQALVQQEKYPWISLHDSEKTYSTIYNVTSIPFTILVDKNGNIYAKNVRGPALEESLKVLLGN